MCLLHGSLEEDEKTVFILNWETFTLKAEAWPKLLEMLEVNKLMDVCTCVCVCEQEEKGLRRRTRGLRWGNRAWDT